MKHLHLKFKKSLMPKKIREMKKLKLLLQVELLEIDLLLLEKKLKEVLRRQLLIPLLNFRINLRLLLLQLNKSLLKNN